MKNVHSYFSSLILDNTNYTIADSTENARAEKPCRWIGKRQEREMIKISKEKGNVDDIKS